MTGLPAEAGLTVRPARPEDHAALGDLLAEAALADGVAGPYVEVIRDVAARAASAEVLVAEGASGFVGGVTLVADGGPFAEQAGPDEAEFRMLAVAPPARGRGAGEALVRACIRRARELGRSRLVLSMRPELAAARRLYARLGFVRAPERDWSPVKGLRLEVSVLDLWGIDVRPARAGELDEAGQVTVAAYRALLGDRLDAVYAAALLDAAERARHGEVLVAAAADSTVLGAVALLRGPGSLTALAEDGEAELRMLGVDPLAQGHGVGTELVRACIRRAMSWGRRRLVLTTTAPMVTAQRLYPRLGFERRPDRDADRHGVRLLAYALDLSTAEG